MQSIFLDSDGRSAQGSPAAGSSSAQLCENTLCLCRRLEVSEKNSFHALLLCTNYLGPAGSSGITPNSKKRVQVPLTLVSAAAVLAALTIETQPKSCVEEVLKAASGLFGSYFATTVTLETLKKSATEILLGSNQPAAGPTTAHLVQDLYAALPNDLSSQIDLKLAFLLLTLLCLSQNGAQCGALLLKGGTLAAGACLAAAYCLAAPPPPQSDPDILPAIASLTGFPEDVIFNQTASLLYQALL